MIAIRKTFALLLLFSIVAGCKHKKKPSLTGEEPVKVGDFLDYFKPVTLPFQYSDSSLAKTKKGNDSLLLGYTVFTQFVPDSILRPVYGKTVKPKIYALGKLVVPGGETYLFVKTSAQEKRCLYLVVFDRKQQYINYLTGLRPDQNPSTQQSFVMDRRLTITKSIIRRNADGSSNEGKDVYSFNADAKAFTLIMTDALEDKPTELINPIDTLPRKHKYAADYVKGKMNLVSVRDGRRSDRLSFFIHFDKGKDCSGELKGEAIIRSANTAEYNKDGDPCKLKFIFSSSSVTLKEMEGCGSYRPLNCSFDGNFPRKKEVKPRPPRKKKK